MPRMIWCLWLLGAALTIQTAAAQEGFSIRRAEILRSGSQYVLDADIAYVLSDSALEALENSVPLTIILQCTIERERRHLWNERLADYRRHFQIRYHPLGQLFQLTFEDLSHPQSYASLRSLLAALGTIRGLPIIAADRIEGSSTYWATLSVQLDIESLPLPLRPSAYLSPSWYLSSPPFRWSFARSE